MISYWCCDNSNDLLITNDALIVCRQNEIRKQIVAIDSDPLLTKAEKAQQKQSLYIAYNLNGTLGSHSLTTTVSPLSNSFYSNDTVESVVGKLRA